MISYTEALSELYGLSSMGIVPGLDRIKSAAEVLNISSDNFFIVQIAGTNGKGSVSYLLEQMFIDAGKRTGLFTSPHLFRFTERIRVDGNEISRQECAYLADSVLSEVRRSGIKLTFFETVTLMAMKYFEEQKQLKQLQDV
jgi:dihydrofolate synthase/folylpolyglutamate synthase